MKEAEILNEGKTLIYPTDTIWGIGCDALNIKAIENVKQIKGREEGKSFILLMKDVAMLSKYVETIPLQAMELMQKFDNENIPITILYPNSKNLPLKNLSFNEYIGIRLPKNDFLQKLFLEFDKPIISSSANFSGRPSPQNFSQIDKNFLKVADYVSFSQREDTTMKTPSLIFMLTKEGIIKQLR